MTKQDKKLSIIPFVVLVAISIMGLIFDAVPVVGTPNTVTTVALKMDAGDTAWMLISTALVLIMTPGLALFYAGMVNAKNLISTMLQSFICMGIISVLWIVVGFSLAFGDSIGGIIGNPMTHFMFKGVFDGGIAWVYAPTIPFAMFALFQLKFAVITPALITGSFSERVKFTSYILFACLFSILIYAPLAHMTWHPEGLLCKWGVLDFAGGTVVHISAGCAALAAALYLGKRKTPMISEPANIPYVLLGTGLLWFGWFGFNAGSAVGVGASGLISSLAVSAFAATNTAAAAAGMAWILFDSVKGKAPSAMGFCIGVVVGLVAITPAAGFVTVPVSIFIGVVASIISNLMVTWRARTGIDDTLDVFPCHGIGGISGMLLTGIFANAAINTLVTKETQGLFYNMSSPLFLKHVLALLGVATFAFAGSFLLLFLTNLISPLRVPEEDEKIGLDVTQHGEKLTWGGVE